jgi:hypothetical protein
LRSGLDHFLPLGGCMGRNPDALESLAIKLGIDRGDTVADTRHSALGIPIL